MKPPINGNHPTIVAGFLALLFLGTTALLAQTGPDLIIAEFESPNYGDWRTTGEAFGPGPARGTLPGQMVVSGFKGERLVNSFYNGDGTTGTLTSPPFKIERKFIGFLIGGGKDAERTCMNLLITGRIVRTATGPNDKPGGSEELAPEFWDVSEFAGQAAVIQIVDRATGGWGHINVDHIVQTDRKPPGWLANAKRDFKIEKRYLNLPIKNGANKRKVTTMVDGRVQVKNDIELADGEPEWWAFMDVSEWRGQTVTLQVDKLPEDSKALSAIEQSDTIKGGENLYRETLRPQFHFSSRRGWLNDPNGLSFYDGEYHLFYQHNPYGWGWGNMHWGHAVSRDLVHWRELGDVLAPDDFGPMFSGSAVVDWHNTSGLGKDGRPPLVLIYTAAGDPTVQCIASSTDGRHFTKYPGNPVLKQITGGNRDPKVIWHEPTRHWVMVLYVALPGNQHTVHFFTSPNLRQWTLASIFEGGKDRNNFLYECPDFFELPVDGDRARTKWVLIGANDEHAIGSFDGTTFTAEATKLPGQRGRTFYAAQTFSDEPQGRRIQIGWLRADSPGMSFNQCMCIPRELRLVSTVDGPRLASLPVKELESLRTKSHRLAPPPLQSGSNSPIPDIQAELVELRAEFEPGDAEITFILRGARISYDGRQQELDVNGVRVPAPLLGNRQRIIVYSDRTTLEAFASDGLVGVPVAFVPNADDFSLGVISHAPVTFRSLEVYELKSAWAE